MMSKQLFGSNHQVKNAMCAPGWCQGCDRPILRYNEEEVLCRECREKGIVGIPTPLVDEHGVPREPGTGNPLTIEGAWKDVRQKGKTINTEGAVEIIRLDDEVIASRVIGDHDTYSVVIYRQFPGEGGVTTWECSCKWGDWAFKRTLYNGRMCSHALATLYAAHGYEHRKAKISRKDPDTIIDDPGEHYNPSASTILREDRDLTLPTHEVFKLLQRTQPHLVRTKAKNTARDWDKLESSIRQNGVQHGIFITVDADPEGGHNVRPIINEGTHRTSIAYYLGKPEIPVEAIRYFGASARQIEKPLHEQMWEDHASCAECNRSTFTSKIAGETIKQKLMRMKSLDDEMGPRTSQKVWEDDSGNAVYLNHTKENIQHEGYIMSNCWRGAKDDHYGTAYSLRDKRGITHVAADVFPAKHNISFDNYAYHPAAHHPQLGLNAFDRPIIMSQLGTHNAVVSVEHQNILKQFARDTLGPKTLIQSRMGAEFYDLDGNPWKPGSDRPEALAWHDELINRKRCSSPDHDRLVQVFGYCGQCRLKAREAKITYSTERTSLACIYTGDGEVDVHIEIAKNPSAIMHGLMHRSYLPWDSGMAFLFPRLTSDGFWMKNTFIPLSIAFWDSEGYIIDIQDMEPDTDEFNKKVHRPSRPYIGALEVNQGFFDFHRIKIGDKITVIE